MARIGGQLAGLLTAVFAALLLGLVLNDQGPRTPPGSVLLLAVAVALMALYLVGGQVRRGPRGRYR